MINDIDILKKDLPYIYNINNFLVIPEKYHPSNPKYIKQWNQYKKHCIEGLWSYDQVGWRFMPATLFYYANFFKLEHTENKQRRMIKPIVRDIDWLIHYTYLEALGFSGFKDDEVYTSDEAMINPDLFMELKNSENDYQRIRYYALYNSEGKIKTYVPPRQYIKKLHEQPLDRPLYYNQAHNVLLFGTRSGGKALSPNELVRIADGWKMIKDLQVGEKVYDMYGKMSSIISKTETQKNLNFYKLRTRDNREILACEDHNWRVFDSISRSYKVVNTKFIFENSTLNRGEPRFALPIASAIENSEKPISIHPYILGVLIGDGGMTNYNVRLTSADREIIDNVNRFLPEGYFLRFNSKYGYTIARKNNLIPAFNSYIRELGLFGKKSEDKFIPEDYLFNSIENRTWLLKGLMDTDGYSDNTHIEFYTSSKRLGQDFQDLARSLGISCKASIKKTSYKKDNVKINCLDCHRISIYTDQPVFSLVRKLRYLDHEKSNGGQSKYDKTYIVDIEYVGKQDGICIGVDNETKTYITKNYLVTHNSYSVSGIVNQTMTFDGLKEYTLEAIESKPKVNIAIGSSDAKKSSELVSKITRNFELHGTDPDFGAYGTAGSKDFETGAFYIDWIGSSKPNNSSNPYRYEYDVETSQGWQTLGSGTKLIHYNYSEKKSSGSSDAAGSRNALNVYEEVGLMTNFRDVLLQNEPTVSGDGERNGVQFGLGTSGDIEAVQQTKMVFNDPETYHFLAFDNIWEPSENKIGLFIPAYLSDRRFKDKNGNTDIQRALEFFVKRREVASKVDDAEVLRNEKMNFPLVPSDMWTSSKSSYFPIGELLDREKELIQGKLFKTIGKPVKLVWDTKVQNGVRADLDEEAEPFYTFPFSKSMSKDDNGMTKLDGAPVMYEPPITSYGNAHGEIPKDFYIYVLDPYVSENIDEGGSLGSFQIYINKRYTKEGYNGDQLVFSYHGKNPQGKDAFYEVTEKAIQLYGACPRMFWYEANRGDSVRGYYVRKNKTHLLCLRPTREKGSAAKERQVAEYGYMVSNKIDKLDMITDAAEWLLSFTQRNGKQIRVYETLPDLFLVQQLIQYTIDGNFDAVSALLGLPLALKEMEHQYVFQAEKAGKKNPLFHIVQATSVNPNILGKNVREPQQQHTKSHRRYY